MGPARAKLGTEKLTIAGASHTLHTRRAASTGGSGRPVTPPGGPASGGASASPIPGAWRALFLDAEQAAGFDGIDLDFQILVLLLLLVVMDHERDGAGAGEGRVREIHDLGGIAYL